jgi:hypothetical protein
MQKGRFGENVFVNNLEAGDALIYSIDYYSFIIPVRIVIYENERETLNHAIQEFLRFVPDIEHHKFGLGNWGIEQSRGFYSTRIRHEISGVAISFGTVNSHLFCELSGRACNNFDAIDALDPLINATKDKCSRIDFAVDIATECDPEHFCTKRGGNSFKSNGTIVSPSGKTCYLGSRKSERMARVYRYAPPHPRSGFLRVEAEYKGDAAKAAASHFTETDIRTACVDAHKPFGWLHDDWNTEGDAGEKIAYTAYRPSNASTVRWLYGDVITALRKAIQEGLVDLDDWLGKLGGD